jgi:hypothetical protein
MLKAYGSAKYGAGLEKNAAMLDHAALDSVAKAGLQMIAVWAVPEGLGHNGGVGMARSHDAPSISMQGELRGGGLFQRPVGASRGQ